MSFFHKYFVFSLRWCFLCFLPRKYLQVRHLSFVIISTFRLFDFVGFAVGDIFGLSYLLIHFGNPFGSLLRSFKVFWQPFGTLGLHSGALGPQVGRMTPQGRIGGEFVVQMGSDIGVDFSISFKRKCCGSVCFYMFFFWMVCYCFLPAPGYPETIKIKQNQV